MKQPPNRHTKKTDRLFAEPMDRIAGFQFDDSVADVFEDMIQRSVPGYAAVVGISGVLAARFAQPASRLFDLGCSLGATSLAMANNVHAVDCVVVAVDNSEPMIRRLQDRLDRTPLPVPVEVIAGDILDTPIHNASVVALNYTLQFVPRARRHELLSRIHGGMLDEGVLILSEKIRFEDPDIHTLLNDLYHEYKQRQGYSKLEISQKRTALENVLIPETMDEHRTRLREAGFSRVEIWFQCFNFISFVAFK